MLNNLVYISKIYFVFRLFSSGIVVYGHRFKLCFSARCGISVPV